MDSVFGKAERPLVNTIYVYPVITGKELYHRPMEDSWDRPGFIFGIGIGKTFREGDFSYEKVIARLPPVFAFLSSRLRFGRYPNR
jgi:hypothetical protein